MGTSHRTDPRRHGTPCREELPPVPGAQRLSRVAGWTAQVPTPARHGDRSAHPAATARQVTMAYDPLASAYGHEIPANGAMYRTVALEGLEADETEKRRRAMVNATACHDTTAKPAVPQHVSPRRANTVDVKHVVPQRRRELAVAAHRRPQRADLRRRPVRLATPEPHQYGSDLRGWGRVVEIGLRTVAARCLASDFFADRCGEPFSARLLATGHRS
jgi:hypothetical protein